MKVEPIEQQPINDDQELAKVLAGVNQDADDSAAAGVGTTFAPLTPPAPDPAAEDAAAAPAEPAADAPVADPIVAPPVAPNPIAPINPNAPAGELDGIKQQALSELRPLVDKLQVSAEEKFDTYLLLLRSTDDKELIAPAHEAAKNISDETRRAQALLDIIKEIDFLSAPAQPAA